MFEKQEATNQTKTLIIKAYREIKQMIFEQKLVPGQKLVYQDLGNMLHMSRTPIINALNRLEQEGFVASESFRGFYVKPLDLHEVWDAFGVREALEVYGVEQAIKLGDDGEMAILEQRLLDHENYMPHYYTPKKFMLDSEFHTQIAAVGKNDVMKWLLKRNFEHIYLRARLENYNPQRMVIAAQEHHRLFNSMKKKDILGSIEIIRNHVQKARDNVIRCLSTEAYDEAVST